MSVPGQMYVLDTQRKMLRFAKFFSRLKAAQMKNFEAWLRPDDYAQIAASEGGGLPGDDDPIQPEEWEQLDEVELLVQSYQRCNTPEELAPLLDIMYKMRARLARRMFKTKVIRHEFGEWGDPDSAGEPPPRLKMAGEEESAP